MILGMRAGLGTVGNRVRGKELTQEATRFCSLKPCLVFPGYQSFSLLEQLSAPGSTRAGQFPNGSPVSALGSSRQEEHNMGPRCCAVAAGSTAPFPALEVGLLPLPLLMFQARPSTAWHRRSSGVRGVEVSLLSSYDPPSLLC